MNMTFLLLQLALNFSQSHTYCMYDSCPAGVLRYNCADFSRDLVLILRANNFTAYPMCGWMGHTYHAWVGVEIEENLKESVGTQNRNSKSDTGETSQDAVKSMRFSSTKNLIQIEPQAGRIIKPDNLNYIRGRRCISRGLV